MVFLKLVIFASEYIDMYMYAHILVMQRSSETLNAYETVLCNITADTNTYITVHVLIYITVHVLQVKIGKWPTVLIVIAKEFGILKLRKCMC